MSEPDPPPPPTRGDQVPATLSLTLPRHPVRALVHAWLILDFFADNRRSGQPSSSLTTTIFGQAFLALVFAALLFPDTPPGAFAAANLSLSTLLVGIGHLGDEHGANRARADRALVAVSPLSRSAVLAARALHASFYVCLLTIGMALPPAILTTFLPGQTVLALPLYLGLACVCSGLFTAALALLLRGLERALGSGRAELAGGTVKALLLLAGLVSFALCVRHLDAGVEDLPLPAWLVQIWPPYHAGRVIAGDLLGAPPLLAAAGLVMLAVLPLTRDPEATSPRRVATPRPLAWLNAHLAGGHPVVHALAAFSSAMLYRSAGFRGRVLPLFGLPAGMWLLAFLDRSPDTARRLLAVATQLPAVYLPFLIAFLGAGDEPRARWLFASSPDLPAGVVRRGIAIALTTHVLLPVHGVLFAVSIPTAGVILAFATSTFAFGLSILVARLALRKWEDVPFSGTPEDGGPDFGGLLTIAVALTLLGLGASALPTALASVLGVAVLSVAYLNLRRSEA